MPKILLADSGSTKTHWVLLQGDKIILNVRTRGLNPYFLSEENIENEIKTNLLPHVFTSKINKIFFYGAGCSTIEKKKKVKNVLRSLFPGVDVMVEHDMMGVARALFGKKQGIACILGTGSNACLYDGNEILLQIPSFGYLWGDQGSGSYLGKKWVECYFYNYMPTEVCISFEKMGYSVESILSSTYSSPTPNRYLASLAPTILQLSEHEWVRKFIEKSFDDFFDIVQSHLPNYSSFPMGFCGSIAYHFKAFLTSVCNKKNIPSPVITIEPMSGLIQYHAEV